MKTSNPLAVLLHSSPGSEICNRLGIWLCNFKYRTIAMQCQMGREGT
jgi:hypothetical protein